MVFTITPEVDVQRNTDGHVVQLRHARKRYSAQTETLGNVSVAELCANYIRDVAPHFGIATEETDSLAESLGSGPAEEGVRIKQLEQKSIVDSTLVSYQQTYQGLPVWNATFSVTLANDPPEIISSNSSLHTDIEVNGPPADQLMSLSDYRPTTLFDAIGVNDSVGSGFVFNGSRLLVYLYEPDEREESGDQQVDDESEGAGSEPGGTGATGAEFDPSADYGEAGFDPANPAPSGSPVGGERSYDFVGTAETPPPSLPLPPVPDSIVPGRHYVVWEVLFTLTTAADGELNWRAFVEVETRAVLHLRALTAGATCCVFETDPISKTGNVLTGASSASALNAARTCGLPLQNLDPPVGGVQFLNGKYARLQNTDAPNIAAPTTTAPFNYEYTANTDDFTAVNAYYHTDWMYRLVEGMGFDLSSYFDGTTFPVPVDHRGEGGGVNARANGNAAGNGMGRFRYGLVQSGQPVGIATTVRVCLHEFGHALLWDHVNSPNFGWAHSAGDTLAAVLNDPGSNAPDRYATFPFVTASSGIDRRHDRKVSDGWAFGGAFDNRQYGSEQILATLMFRCYQVTGGDSTDISEKQFAARYLCFLIIRAIGALTSTTTDPRVYVNALMDADELTTNFEGHPGGAWHKVIRWNFETQGLYQPAGAPTPVTAAGAPPDVDVYINDGRKGNYQPYLSNFGNSPDVWNRLAADGGTVNQEPSAGVTNYAYARVSNRGTQTATNVSVKFYQGVSPTKWPADWSATATPSASGPDIPSGGNTIVGPFKWVPGQAGPASVLASVSARGDSSNADTVNGAIVNARLIPNDNNLAQRDFTVAAGDSEACFKIGCGSTNAGATDWITYVNNTGIYVDVDTSACGFTETPRYITSLGGRSSHWSTTGATSIYRATKTGFRVYVRWSSGASITPAQANSLHWHINWFATQGT